MVAWPRSNHRAEPGIGPDRLHDGYIAHQRFTRANAAESSGVQPRVGRSGGDGHGRRRSAGRRTASRAHRRAAGRVADRADRRRRGRGTDGVASAAGTGPRSARCGSAASRSRYRNWARQRSRSAASRSAWCSSSRYRCASRRSSDYDLSGELSAPVSSEVWAFQLASRRIASCSGEPGCGVNTVMT
jgi:hypothetical protein